MADNFNLKQFLAENKLGAYSRLKEGEAAYEYEKGKEAGEQEEKEKLSEYEVIYVERNGRCYRKDDEGNMDEVNMSYCRRYAENKEENKDEINEAVDPNLLAGILGILLGGGPIVAALISDYKNAKTPEEKQQVLQKASQTIGSKMGGLSESKKKDKEPVKEALSMDAMERMDGLVSISAMQALTKAVSLIIRDLRAEGFEDDEIFEYIVTNIKTGV